MGVNIGNGLNTLLKNSSIENHIYILMKLYMYFVIFSYIFQEYHTLEHLFVNHFYPVFLTSSIYLFASMEQVLDDNHTIVDIYDQLYFPIFILISLYAIYI